MLVRRTTTKKWVKIDFCTEFFLFFNIKSVQPKFLMHALNIYIFFYQEFGGVGEGGYWGKNWHIFTFIDFFYN